MSSINEKSITTGKLAKKYVVDSDMLIPSEELGDVSVDASAANKQKSQGNLSTRVNTAYLAEIGKGNYSYAYVNGKPSMVETNGNNATGGGSGSGSGSGGGSSSTGDAYYHWEGSEEWPS